MKIRTAFAIALLTLPAAAPAFAAVADLRQACRDDVKQLCSGVQPGVYVVSRRSFICIVPPHSGHSLTAIHVRTR